MAWLSEKRELAGQFIVFEIDADDLGTVIQPFAGTTIELDNRNRPPTTPIDDCIDTAIDSCLPKMAWNHQIQTNLANAIHILDRIFIVGNTFPDI